MDVNPNDLNMSPEQLQAWCDAQPSYDSYKKECSDRRKKFAEEKGLTLEELEHIISKPPSDWPASLFESLYG